MRARPDVVFFLLDSVRPDRVAACGGRVSQRLFLDEVLGQSALFTKVIAAGPYTLIALNALFTSLCATTNGVNGAYKTTSGDLHPEAITLTELLQQHGYATMCYAGSPFEAMEPLPGFERYELLPQLDLRVLRAYRAAAAPRFLCLSFQQVHDACCRRPGEMTPANYDAELARLDRDFERWYRALVGPDTLALVYSDHGMRLRERLDPAYEARPEQEPTTGVYLRDETIVSFAGFCGAGLFAPRRIDAQIRSIDLAPTLLEALGLPPLGGQGASLWRELRAGLPIPERLAFCETGGRWFSPFAPELRGLRSERAKFTQHERLGPALYDLARDPGETRNRAGTGDPREVWLRAELERTTRRASLPPRHFYAAAGVDWQGRLARRAPLPVVAELSQAMTAYEGIALALARAELADARRHASDLARLLAREADKAASEAERTAFLAARERAERRVAAAPDLAAARDGLAALSELFCAYVAARPSFHDSLVRYECELPQGPRRWLQKRNDAAALNPYLDPQCPSAAPHAPREVPFR